MALFEIFDRNGGPANIPRYSDAQIEAFIRERKDEPYYARIIGSIGAMSRVGESEVHFVMVSKLTDAQRATINMNMAAAAYFASLKETDEQ